MAKRMTIRRMGRGLTITVGVAALLSGAPVAAQDSGAQRLLLSMDEALTMALQTNLGLENERLNLSVADEGIASARALFLPQLSSSFGRTTSESVPLDFTQGSSTISSENVNVSGAVSQALPFYGGGYSVVWSASRNEQAGGFSSFNPRVGSTLRVNYTQPLLRNFSIDLNRATLETTQRRRAIADLQLEQRIVNTEVQVRNAYLNLVAASEAYKVSQQNMDLAETSLRQARARVDVGVSPEIEIIQAQAQVASNTDQLIATEAAIDTAEDALRQLIMDPNHPDYWTVEIEPTDTIQLTQRTIEVDVAVANALADRLDMLTLLRNLEITDLNVRVGQNLTKATLDLNVGYVAQGTGGTLLQFGQGFPPPVVGEDVKSFGSVLGDTFGGAFPTWTLGLTFSYPLGRSSAEANLAQQQIQRRQQTISIRELELQIVREVREAARQVDTSYQRFLAQQANREASDQQLLAEERRFAVGLSSTFELQQRQSQLFFARNAELTAMINYNRALIRFDQVQRTQ